jgi:hypothetical protein
MPEALIAAHPSKPLPEAEAVYNRWIAHLDAEFARHQNTDRRAEIVRDELHQLFLGRPHGGKLNFTLDTELPFNVLELTLDPRNITFEAESYDDVDPDLYALRKPLIWFWRMFDRSPVGLNHWVGVRLRSMLGRHIFRHMGRDVKICHNVTFTFGYNLIFEDNCTVRSNVLLDDRSELVVPSGAMVTESFPRR